MASRRLGEAFRTLVKKNAARSYFGYSREIAQPLNRQPEWTTPEKAVCVIESGDYSYYLSTQL